VDLPCTPFELFREREREREREKLKARKRGRDTERTREREGESQRGSAKEKEKDRAEKEQNNEEKREPARKTRKRDQYLISQKVFTRSFCNSQFLHQSVNLSFIITYNNR